mmetsp:Transcript_45729/g.151622  ORF Transcript_45729/g.151622 Transcript_45729/m.151622 type:complete len:262 (+) Transcript_45729:1117-1902(+)
MDHGEAQQLHHHVEEADDGRLGRVLVGEVRLALAHRHDDVHRVDEEEDDAEGERGQRGDEGEDEVEDAVVARRPLAARRLGKEREAKLLGAVPQLVHQWGVLVHEVVVRGAERERHRLPCRLRVGEVVRRGVRKDGGRERVREPERRVQPPDDGAERAPLEVEEGLDRRRLEDGAVAGGDGRVDDECEVVGGEAGKLTKGDLLHARHGRHLGGRGVGGGGGGVGHGGGVAREEGRRAPPLALVRGGAVGAALASPGGGRGG